MTEESKTEKKKRYLIATDDRNGALCVNYANYSPSLVELGRALLGSGTQYICAPVNDKPYVVDVLTDPVAEKHVYTNKKQEKKNGLEL